jgi:hypothetical protein
MPDQQQVKKKDVWDKIAVFLPLVQAGVLAAVGYFLTTAVEAGFKSQEVKLSQVREMRSQFAKLFDESVSDHDALKNALMLAAFGPPAIDPLTIALTEHGGDIQGPAAMEALRFIGFTHPDETCDAAVRLVENRTRLLPWRSYHLAICLIGETRCKGAKKNLMSFRARLGEKDANALASRFTGSPPLTVGALADLKAAIDDSLQVLNGAPPVSHSCQWGAP